MQQSGEWVLRPFKHQHTELLSRLVCGVPHVAFLKMLTDQKHLQGIESLRSRLEAATQVAWFADLAGDQMWPRSRLLEFLQTL